MDKNRNVIGTIIGGVLILIGILALFGRNLAFFNMDMLWPLVVIGIGIALFIPMLLGDRSRGGLAVPGSILITIGLITFVMNSTDTWEAWSYSWALIIAAVGAGMWINGYWSEQPELRTRGMRTLRTGLILFVVVGVIMEFIFSVTDVTHRGSYLIWAILLTLIGIYLLVARLLRVGKTPGERVDLFWPVLMIGVGITACLVYWKVMPVGNLGWLGNLWPLLLIAAGLSILFRNRSTWVGLIMVLLIVACIFIVGFAGDRLGFTSVGWISNLGPIEFGEGTHQTIVGSGKVVTENRPVSGISRVELATDARLDIHQGASDSLSVTGDDNVLSVLQTYVSGDRLIIRYKPQVDVRNSSPLKISLTVKNLNGLKVSSSGDILVAPFTTNDFNLIISSSGNVDIQGIQANVITTHISSSGDITIQGSANTLDLDVSSSGEFKGGDLKVQKANIKLSSSGEVTVWVVNDLRANISSSGNISYYGSPAISQSLSSSGKLIPLGAK